MLSLFFRSLLLHIAFMLWQLRRFVFFFAFIDLMHEEKEKQSRLRYGRQSHRRLSSAICYWFDAPLAYLEHRLRLPVVCTTRSPNTTTNKSKKKQSSSALMRTQNASQRCTRARAAYIRTSWNKIVANWDFVIGFLSFLSLLFCNCKTFVSHSLPARNFKLQTEQKQKEEEIVISIAIDNDMFVFWAWKWR